MITFKHTLLLSLFSLLVLTSKTTYAQKMSEADSKAKAQQIINRYLEAIGGRENLAKVKSWKTFGLLKQADQKAYPMNTSIKGDKVFIETTVKGAKLVQGHNGDKTWQAYDLDGGIPRYVDNPLKAAHALNKCYAVSLLKNSSLAMYEGERNWHQEPVYVVYYGDKKGRNTYYFSKKTGLLLYRKTPYVTTFYTEYTQKKDVSGLYLPKTSTVTSTATIFVDSIQTNVTIDDSLFELPDKSPNVLFKQLKNSIIEGKTLKPDAKLTVEQIEAQIQNVLILNKTKDVAMEGRAFINLVPRSFPVRFFMVPHKGKSYVEMKIMNRTFKQVSNGKIAWEVTPDNPKPRIVTKNNHFLGAGFSKSRIFSHAHDHETKYVSRVYIGKKLYHKLTLIEEGQTVNIYLDVDTYKTVITKKELGQDNFLYSKQEYENGVIVPRLMYLKAGETELLIKMDTCNFNTPVDEQMFEFPKKKK